MQGSVAIIAAMVNRTFQSSLEVQASAKSASAPCVYAVYVMTSLAVHPDLHRILTLQVGVRVEEEDMLTGARHHCCSAYLTFVSVMARSAPGRVPKPLPKITPTSPHQREIFRAGQLSLLSPPLSGPMPSPLPPTTPPPPFPKTNVLCTRHDPFLCWCF